MTRGHSHAIALPKLRIVPTETIYPHEDEDSQRAQPLAQAIQNDGALKNPIIVTSLKHGLGYLLLDGTNRFTAFRQLGIPHMLVQIVPYSSPDVELASWNHIVGNTTEQAFMDTLKQFDDDDLHIQQGYVTDEQPLARITFPEGERVITITSPQPSLAQKIDRLRRLVNAYMQVGRLNRTTSHELSELQTTYPDIVCLIEFIPLTPSDIQNLHQQGQKVPAGITRHIIQGRALRLNYPLESLRATISLDEKNTQLDEWVARKFADRNVRLYTEATYQFED